MAFGLPDIRAGVDGGPSMNGQTVLIRVGQQDGEFTVHKNILTKKSEPFKSMMLREGPNGERWREGGEHSIYLQAVGSQEFEIWLKWLYTGVLFIDCGNTEDNFDFERQTKELSHWEKSYKLADLLQDHACKNDLVRALIELSHIMVPVLLYVAETVYAASCNDSKHRELLVELCVYVIPRIFCETDSDLPVEFLFDVLEEIRPKLQHGIPITSTLEFFSSLTADHYNDVPSELISPEISSDKLC